MTKDQFMNLKIGDRVLSSDRSAVLSITDIHRDKGLVNTGKHWMSFRGVTLVAEEKYKLTEIEPPTHILFSVAMLKEFGLIGSAIILAIRRAGPEGFVGSNESLVRASGFADVRGSYGFLVRPLVDKNVVRRELVSRTVTRFTLVEENLVKYG